MKLFQSVDVREGSWKKVRMRKAEGRGGRVPRQTQLASSRTKGRSMPGCMGTRRQSASLEHGGSGGEGCPGRQVRGKAGEGVQKPSMRSAAEGHWKVLGRIADHKVRVRKNVQMPLLGNGTAGGLWRLRSFCSGRLLGWSLTQPMNCYLHRLALSEK